LFWAAFTALALVSYHPSDPSFNHAVSGASGVRNAAGLVGSHTAGLLVDFFGLGAWFWPLGFLVGGLGLMVGRLRFSWWRWAGYLLLVPACLGLFAHPGLQKGLSIGFVSGGGFFGELLYVWTRYFLRPAGAFLLWLFSMITALQLMFCVTWGEIARFITTKTRTIAQNIFQDISANLREIKERQAERQAAKPKKEAKPKKPKKPKKEKRPEPEYEDDFTEDFDLAPEPQAASKKQAAKPAPKKPGKKGAVVLPDTEFLHASPQQKASPVSKQLLEERAESLIECLSDFGIHGEIQDVSPGPVVTMFEIKPAPGVKISRIAGLSDDLALALRAASVRVEAPLYGRDTVGVEIPNEERQTVWLKDIIESKAFSGSKSMLTLALGQDIHGRSFADDLAKMPHLLVAGATGAGKSVCLNTILLSFLYKAGPDEVKLLLVDPKRIELAVYADLPHLVHPVVTDMSLAKNAMDWAVAEMERRYDSMARLGVRNITGYNEKLAVGGLPEDLLDLEPMPYLVIIIDELADLMMTGAKEVEQSIVRLAQLARAAGIHMILATQRPSVDVVTGLIKANFPSRISFQVTSKHDSRTILDGVGAEHLLGKGDMLYKPSGKKMMRLHGAFVDEEEIARVVDFWKSQAAPAFELDFGEWGAPDETGGPGGDDADVLNDASYKPAVDFVMEQGKASISLIQRRFRIGYNRAARFVEQMERDGIVGPADGSKPRVVLKRGE
jgi:S-DNA-T family DNA segregation ATPase FtsK/SpoIIIE